MGARIRTIKPEFWGDEKVSRLQRPVRLTFLGLISAASDDAGRCRGNPRAVRAAVYPLDEDISTEEISAHLDQLAAVGLIKLYSVNSEPYIEIANFTRHQRIQRPSPSQLPPPPPVSETAESLREESVIDRGLFADRSANAPTVVERSGKDGSSINESATRADGQELKASSVGAQGPTAAFPRDVCDRLYEGWLNTGRSIEYPRFRKALKPLFATAAPRYSERDLTNAIIAFNEAADGASADKSQFWHVNKFVDDVGRWVRLGAMPLADANGLTERGRAAVGAVR
jgi:hypothetical protein